MPKQVLAKIETRPVEPSWTFVGLGRRHAITTKQHRAPRCARRIELGDDATEAPYRGPEFLRLRYRPIVETGVVANRCATTSSEVGNEAGKVRPLDRVRRGRPEWP